MEEIKQKARAHGDTFEQDIEAGIVKKHFEQAVILYQGRIASIELHVPAGFRRRRFGYDQLNEAGRFTADFIFEEYPKILQKKSTLSRSVRETVREVGDIAMASYVKERRRRDEEAKKEQTQ